MRERLVRFGTTPVGRWEAYAYALLAACGIVGAAFTWWVPFVVCVVFLVLCVLAVEGQRLA